MADTCLVYFFKEAGKYYTEEQVIMPYKEDGYMPDYFKQCLRVHLMDGRLKGMIAVCIEPNHKMAFPLLIRVDDLYKENPPYQRI